MALNWLTNSLMNHDIWLLCLSHGVCVSMVSDGVYCDYVSMVSGLGYLCDYHNIIIVSGVQCLCFYGVLCWMFMWLGCPVLDVNMTLVSGMGFSCDYGVWCGMFMWLWCLVLDAYVTMLSGVEYLCDYGVLCWTFIWLGRPVYCVYVSDIWCICVISVWWLIHGVDICRCMMHGDHVLRMSEEWCSCVYGVFLFVSQGRSAPLFGWKKTMFWPNSLKLYFWW